MNETDLTVIGTCLFVTGTIFGIAFSAMWRTAADEVKENKHQETVIEQGREIARLRAQVALHIGKEK